MLTMVGQAKESKQHYYYAHSNKLKLFILHFLSMHLSEEQKQKLLKIDSHNFVRYFLCLECLACSTIPLYTAILNKMKYIVNPPLEGDLPKRHF